MHFLTKHASPFRTIIKVKLKRKPYSIIGPDWSTRGNPSLLLSCMILGKTNCHSTCHLFVFELGSRAGENVTPYESNIPPFSPTCLASDAIPSQLIWFFIIFPSFSLFVLFCFCFIFILCHSIVLVSLVLPVGLLYCLIFYFSFLFLLWQKYLSLGFLRLWFLLLRYLN